MSEVYGESTPSYPTVARWSSEFKRGRESIEDDPRSGRPSDAVNSDTIGQVEEILMNNRRIIRNCNGVRNLKRKGAQYHP